MRQLIFPVALLLLTAAVIIFVTLLWFRNERPLIGVHYFSWYRQHDAGWGNDATVVPAGAPRPSLGWYDSSDSHVIDRHISQMSAAGFDFVIIDVIADAPASWARAHQFFERLRRHRLRAAVMLDGLYTREQFERPLWIEKAVTELTGYPNYLVLPGGPLVALFSVPINFREPQDVLLRNVYWTPNYEPANNTFNIDSALKPHDWAFWSPTPQPLINGMVPVMPGYDDTHLQRETAMEFPRRGGQTYHEQWQRALELRPDLIIVYSWNEHFEQTAIEPTDTWGDQYVKWTACYATHARQGTTGAC